MSDFFADPPGDPPGEGGQQARPAPGDAAPVGPAR